ncbi:MAG TPA: amidohydrolase family protein [Chthoniobacterales bacterium]|nr:amidohydrolase family protein [Chthoniobacterales bacterium]
MKIVRARVVVPMEGDPIENGAVAIEGSKIIGVGRFEEVKAGHGGDVLDLGEQILLPGLINAHCHLDYTLLRDKIPPQKSFTAWIRAINAEKAKLTAKDYIASINEGFAEAQSFGTTTIVNLTAFPELIAEIEEPIRTWWFGELIDVRNPDQAGKIVDRAVELLRSQKHWGLAPHAPFTASAQLFSAASEISSKQNVPLTTHVAESREEMQMFRDAAGPLFDFLKSIGRPMDDCGGNTPLSSLIQRHAVDERWILAHLNELTETDFDLLAHAKSFHIAHCPRSHTFFGHTPFAWPRLRALGLNICLGTDSLASNSSLSLLSEMRELRRKEPSVSPREVVTMATANGARAIGRADSLGRISPGFHADLIAIPSPATAVDAFDAIVAFDGTVRWMMVDGEILSLR